jgi:hypothetical protein
MTLTLTSQAFQQNGEIPARHTCIQARQAVTGHEASLAGSPIAPLKRPVCTRERSLQWSVSERRFRVA